MRALLCPFLALPFGSLGYSWGPSQSPEPLFLSNNPTKQDALQTLDKEGRSQRAI